MKFRYFAALGLFAGAVVGLIAGAPVMKALPALAQGSVNVACYTDQGGALFHLGNGCLEQVESGGSLNVASGGAFKVAGVDKTSALAAAVANPVAGAGASYKIVRGQATTATASDTVVTGLATVVSVVCQLDDAPTTDPELASCSIGDQAGSPAAGSILVRTWKTFGGTPAAATTFSKKVNWIAIGN